MTKDYYKILNVSELSTQSEIKSAYRKLARKWHPDVAGNSDEVISRFKEINEAYEVLSNSNLKANYDSARRFYNYAKGEETTSKGEEKKSEAKSGATKPDFKKSGSENKKSEEKNGFWGFKWEEFIAKKYREAQYQKEQEAKAPKKGDDIYTDIEISVFEAINGGVKTVNMLHTHICPNCGGRKFVNGSKCQQCNGKGEKSEYKKFSVKIPAGIKDNSKIRLAGEGEKGLRGGRSGDLYLTVHIVKPKTYETDGLNILKTLTLNPFEAVLGADVKVATLYGNVSVKISPNARSGQKIRLAGCGIESGNKKGDLILTVEIQIPQQLTNEEVELYRRLKEVSSSNVR